MVLLYDRVIQHSQIPVNKSDTKCNWSFNDTCKSLKGILVLFEEEKPYLQDTSKFYNPKIEKVSVTIEGKPNQLYSQGMRSFEQYEESRKYFTEGRLTDEVQAQLQLYDLSVGEYLVNKYAVWLDFRTINENELHGRGSQIGNTSGGITIQIEKKAETVGKMHLVLDLLKNEYRDHFDFIIIICPKLEHNETYKSRGWVWNDPDVIPIEPDNNLYHLVEKIRKMLAGSKTLLLIDDIIANEALDKRRQLLLLTQSYTAIPNNIRR